MNDIELYNEQQAFSNISLIIEKRKFNAVSSANSQVIAMFWEIGKYINLNILADARADYGKKILSTLSTKLVTLYGKSFVEANLYRMKRFATVFPDINTIADFAPFLSWSHFCEIMRIKDEEARLFYAKDAVERQKRIIIDGDDFKIDLLFFHRTLRRLVAVELKIGRFKPKYKGQTNGTLSEMAQPLRTQGRRKRTHWSYPLYRSQPRANRTTRNGQSRHCRCRILDESAS